MKPPVTLSSLDVERLERLLEGISEQAGAALSAEIDRAEIVEPDQMPADVVTMNSTVRFRVMSSGEEFVRTLVYPKDAGAGTDKLSVLAPIGTALLGLAQGAEIEWPAPDAKTVRVRIEEVTGQPEREGRMHR